MDRQIIYPGAIPLETDLLNTNKSTMIAISKIAAAVLGTSTTVNGFAVTPTSPASMQINVAAGEIYALASVDATAYSSLSADTTHSILKQGIALDAQTLTLTAPTTSGYSVNYLIEVAYQDQDTNAVTLPYYNSSNPTQPWSGASNNGQSQYTTRKGVASVQAKAGIAAATNSQTTPAPDSGYVGLYVVTVAYGQTQIVAGNISQYAAAPFINMPTMAQIQAQTGTAFTAAGTAPAYTLAPSPAIQVYASPQRFNVTFPAAGTTGSNTINVSGLGAIPLKQFAADGSLVSGIVTAGMNSDVQIVGAGSYALLLDPLPATAIGVRSARSNLTISYTSTTGVVSVTASELSLESAAGAYTTLKSLSLSATSGNASGAANSLDTGNWAYSTLYNLFVIYNPTTTTSALLWSLSATAPTLPSGYTYFARIGANFTQSATNYWFMGGTQFNDEFFTKVAASGNRTSLQLLSGGTTAQGSVSTPTWVSVALSSYVPPTASKVLVMCNGNGGAAGQSMVAPNNSYGASGSLTNPPPLSYQTPGGGSFSGTQILCMQGEIALESTSIYWAQSGNFYLWMRGWKDNL